MQNSRLTFPPPAARLGALCLLAATIPAFAEPEEFVQLPPWIVTADPVSIDSEPAAPIVLTRDSWSGQAGTTLRDTLGRLPGLIMQESFGGFEPPRLSIRGSGVQSAPSSRGVALLLDGLPLGMADGSFNSALFDPQTAA